MNWDNFAWLVIGFNIGMLLTEVSQFLSNRKAEKANPYLIKILNYAATLPWYDGDMPIDQFRQLIDYGHMDLMMQESEKRWWRRG